MEFLLSATLLLISLSCSTVLSGGTVGINYGRIADNLPPPARVAQLLQSEGITRVKLFDTDSSVLSALASVPSISVTVCLPNGLLSSAASDPSFADSWVRSNVLPYRSQIVAIAVGNEVFVEPKNTPFLVPAMKNVHASLAKNGVASSIKVSSPVALSALQSSYPPSSGSFKKDLLEPVIKPMLEFLNRTGSHLMVNVYPFFAYAANTDTISIDYALFRYSPANDNKDPKSGLVYRCLFDAQVDAAYAAVAAAGFDGLGISVTETGWPSKGEESEPGAGMDNAAAYNGNLVRRVLTGGGTPLRPERPLEVYLFALFNENQKSGPVSEKNYGLFYPDEKKVYDISLTAAGTRNTSAGAVGEEDSKVPAAGQTWCVANENAGVKKLQEALDYACGEGGAECGRIQPGGACYEPNTVAEHASFAFNSYYQKNSRRSGTCYFGGVAHVVTQPPHLLGGNCL